MRCKPRGNPKASIVIVGEAPGEDEERWGLPFVGASGKVLKQLLEEAKIDEGDCYFTNVFMDRPPQNRIGAFCTTLAQAREQAMDLGWENYPFPALAKNLYVEPYRCLELLRLRQEILDVNPNLVVALGNTALWALARVTGIGKWRGAATAGQLTPHKLLATYHPASIFRNYESRIIILVDLLKVHNESQYPELRYKRREIWTSPTLQDINAFYYFHCLKAKALALDIETHTYRIKGKVYPYVSMLGIAPASNLALVIPFIKPNGSPYWEPIDHELEAWHLVQKFMNLPIPKILQNGLFDVQHLLRNAIYVWHYTRDTMNKHHALYPGIQKGLGFMGSVHANEGPWKQFRPKSAVEKPDD